MSCIAPFWTDSRRAGNVVDGIAFQGEQVRNVGSALTPKYVLTSACLYCSVPFIGFSITTPSRTSCIRSLSEETTQTSTSSPEACSVEPANRVVRFESVLGEHRDVPRLEEVLWMNGSWAAKILGHLDPDSPCNPDRSSSLKVGP